MCMDFDEIKRNYLDHVNCTILYVGTGNWLLNETEQGNSVMNEFILEPEAESGISWRGALEAYFNHQSPSFHK